MQLLLRDELLFATATLAYQGIVMSIEDVLIDTGSARTVLSADLVAKIHISPEPEDILYTIHGVGGTEVVFAREVDYLQVGERRLVQFEVEVGGMDYGFEINGILGMDFLRQAGAILDLAKSAIDFV